jgi:hypothetical protein
MIGHGCLFAVEKPLPGRSGSPCAGFSMVEMLVSLCALALLFGAIYQGFERLNRSYTAENVKAGTQQSARAGVETMVQDIRLAGLNPLGSAIAGVVEAGQTVFHFRADLNFDGDCDDPFEDVKYEWIGTDLLQTNHLGPEVLLEDVSSLQFTYLDESGALLPEPVAIASIRTLVISLTLQRPAGRNQTVSRSYTTRVRCRNL